MAKQERLVALDALRGIAILGVLLFHFQQPTGSAPLDALLQPFRVAGWAGVDLFFVLSGYLVGGIVLREATAPGGFDPRRFLARRALRLWPVLYLYLAALALTGFDGPLWPAALHVQNYADDAPSHLWSLAVEEHFYLAAAFLLPRLARVGPRQVFGVLAAVIVGAALLRTGALAAGVTPQHVQWQTQFRADALAAGVALAALRHYHPAYFARVAAFRAPLLIVAVAGFGWLASDPAVATRWGIGLTVAWSASAALVLAAAEWRPAPTIAPVAATFAALGLIAYPLYIWHPSIGHAAAALLATTGITGGTPTMLAELTASILVAWMVRRLVELPGMALRDRRPAPDPDRNSRRPGLIRAGDVQP